MDMGSRRLLAIVLAGGLLAAVASPAGAASETVLHAFQGRSDGALPAAGLTKFHGIFYGTTQNGGASHKGTVFSVTPTGVETVVYSFKGGSDGALPDAALVSVGATFYGTTYAGGGTGCKLYNAVGCGTVFSVTPGGVETVLHAFTGGSDGSNPYNGVVNVNGAFYGTTNLGGGTGCAQKHAIGCGTVFSVTPAGVETVLHAFTGGADGAHPAAGLLDDGGTLYGVTAEGVGTCIGVSGCGTVFSVTPDGREAIVYAFKGGAAGYFPTGVLIDYGGVLYGATAFGGESNGCGTVFSVTPGGVETVLHAFKSGSDGCSPSGGLVEWIGTFYGTTVFGGSNGFGTVFSVTPAGVETVLYEFKGGSDGRAPNGDLRVMNGVLYGTTISGGGTGCGGFGCGTVFSVTP